MFTFREKLVSFKEQIDEHMHYKILMWCTMNRVCFWELQGMSSEQKSNLIKYIEVEMVSFLPNWKDTKEIFAKNMEELKNFLYSNREKELKEVKGNGRGRRK